MWLSRGRVVNARSVQHIHSINRDIHTEHLPESLHGLRITHLSDLHIGHLHLPDLLPGIVDRCNRFEADVIAVTGDLVDLSLEPLDKVIEAMKHLTAPLGVYFVAGNHDKLLDGRRFAARMRQAGLKLLHNETTMVRARGCRIAIAGIDFERRRRALGQVVGDTLNRDPDFQGADLRLLLAHHPDAFEAAARHGVDLTLSGHTHGGQVMLSNQRGKKGSIGLGSMTYRYPHGLYRRGHYHLHVTSGTGTWFPMRLKCPAEVACLTLQCRSDSGEAKSEGRRAQSNGRRSKRIERRGKNVTYHVSHESIGS